MKYWKIQFNDTREGFGYLEFDENMVATNIYDEEGSIITEAVGYFPIEFDNVIPPFIV